MPSNRCDYCNAECDGTFATTWSAPICQACFNRHFFRCVTCGRTAYQGDTPGNNYCSTCFARFAYWKPTDFAAMHNTTKKTGSNLCFGIELETSVCPNHTKLKGKTCFGAKEDGSIGGLEFYSPILRGDRGLSAVRNFCRLAKKQGFDVDHECGFHLHIDMRTMSVRQRRSIAYAYLLTQKLWVDLVAEERWANTYCEPSHCAPSEFRAIGEDAFPSEFERFGDRYSFVNLRAYRDHKTYELRGYQGTLNHVEICNWTKAHLRFVEAVCDKTLDELDTMFRRPKKTMRQILGNQLSRYYAKSWQKNAVCV